LIQPWQDRFRDPALTVLLALEICTICLAVPLAAKGLPTAQVVADTLVLAMIAIVVMLSLRSHAIILILLGLAAIVASFLISAEASPSSVLTLRRGGDILNSALTWVVANGSTRRARCRTR
jgi:hypothetical protein